MELFPDILKQDARKYYFWKKKYMKYHQIKRFKLVFGIIIINVVGSKILALECYTLNSRVNKVY